MAALLRNPVPPASGNRDSDNVNVSTVDGPKITPAWHSSQPQSVPSGFDPLACPILLRHWFGVALRRKCRE
jgi:hypothetical protein